MCNLSRRTVYPQRGTPEASDWDNNVIWNQRKTL